MSANNKQAYVTQVPFGSLTIEGLCDNDKNFYVAQTQAVNQLNLALPTNAGKVLRRILGEEFQPVRLKTSLNPNPVNAITLLDFERLLRKADRQGNETAQALVDSLVGLSLTQVFSDAFGIHFEQEERQQWLILREYHRTTFPQYTAWLHQDGVTNYGKEVNNLKLHSNLPIKKMTEYTQDELNKLTTNETVYATLRRVGFSHIKALRSL